MPEILDHLELKIVDLIALHVEELKYQDRYEIDDNKIAIEYLDLKTNKFVRITISREESALQDMNWVSELMEMA